MKPQIAGHIHHAGEKYDSEFKIHCVKEHYIGGIDSKEIRDKYSIHSDTFKIWCYLFIKGGSTRLRGIIFSASKDREFKRLKNENLELKNKLAAIEQKVDILNAIIKNGIILKRRRRYKPIEKLKLLKIIGNPIIPITHLFKHIDLDLTTYYKWRHKYNKYGIKGLLNKKRSSETWNKITQSEQAVVISEIIENPLMGPKQLRWHILDKHQLYLGYNSVIRIRRKYLHENELAIGRGYKALPEFRMKSNHVHQMWQTDFTELRLDYSKKLYLSVVIDDFSRYIIAWHFSTSPTTDAVLALLEKSIINAGIRDLPVSRRPKLLTDRGGCYTANRLKQYLARNNITHSIGKVNRPTTRGKVERFFKTIKTAMINYNVRSEKKMRDWVDEYMDFYNNTRCHHALNYFRPVDIYEGREQEIIEKRFAVRRSSPRLKGQHLNESDTILQNQMADPSLKRLVKL